VFHRAVALEDFHDLCDGRLLLADRDIDADDAFALLIDDRVDRHNGLASLAIADDQLALAAADRNHGVDGLESRLQRLFHRLAVDDARSDALDRIELGGVDEAFAVERNAERADDAADERGADGNRHDLAGSADFVAFLDALVFAEEHAADVV